MMSSPLAVAVFAVAAALSLGASAVLVVRLERLGARLGLSEALLGLVAALAADTPEVTSAVTALAHGQHDVGTGVVLGSNVFNLAALIGLGAAVAGGIKLHRRVVLFEGTVALSIAALAIAAVTGLITPVAALALALAVLWHPMCTSRPCTPRAAPPSRSRPGCDPGSPGQSPRKNKN
jgi:cation:H+ antiporter